MSNLPTFHNNFHIIPPYLSVISSAIFKQNPDDFLVEEHLGFELTGEGEHLCVYVKKTNANTNQVASALAKWAGIPAKDVSFSGLKDKYAITSQWFSLRIPKKTLPNEPFVYHSEHAEAVILDTVWHQKKLGRGCHEYNAFSITLKEVQGDRPAIEERLATIKAEGVPNYFMAQRFGKEGNNLTKALSLFNRKRKFKREERSIILSSARSYLFNAILAERVNAGTWQTPLHGDVFNLNGSGSIFVPEQIDDDIIKRIKENDIHPTGALWGKGTLKTEADVLTLENSIASQHAELASGLENAGLSQARRSLRLLVSDFSWQWQDDNQLMLSFKLTSGGYATAVLACLIDNFTG